MTVFRVSPGLYAEGPTDLRFLSVILGRMLEEVLTASARTNFDLGNIVEIGTSSGSITPEEAAKEIDAAARGMTLVFVHRDSDRRDGRKVQPWIDAVRAGWTDAAPPLIFTVPVKMTEAWALCDPDALRAALGVTWSDQSLGLPKTPGGVEKVSDPKNMLNAILDRLSGPRVDVLSSLGARVQLDRLRQVPSFRACEDDVKNVLREARIL